jgi:hypothetical protein
MLAPYTRVIKDEPPGMPPDAAVPADATQAFVEAAAPPNEPAAAPARKAPLRVRKAAPKAGDAPG